jgi:inner membrane transporter RhtA
MPRSVIRPDHVPHAFALLLALLPASAAAIGAVVLKQIPTVQEIAGILLVASGVALHKERDAIPRREATVQTSEPQPR